MVSEGAVQTTYGDMAICVVEVFRGEQLAKKLAERLQTGDEADLRKVGHILSPSEVGIDDWCMPVEGWTVLEPDSEEVLAYVTKSGELRCRLDYFFAQSDEGEDDEGPHDSDIGITQYVPWRQQMFDSVDRVQALIVAVTQMNRAHKLLAPPTE